MVPPLFLIGIAGISLVAIFGSLSPSASMIGILQILPAPVVSVAYAGEINQISSLVGEFLELRENLNSDNAKEISEKLDQKINNLGIVRMFCNEKISTLDLAFKKNPYSELQQICPELNNLSLSKAAQLFRQI